MWAVYSVLEEPKDSDFQLLVLVILVLGVVELANFVEEQPVVQSSLSQAFVLIELLLLTLPLNSKPVLPSPYQA